MPDREWTMTKAKLRVAPAQALVNVTPLIVVDGVPPGARVRIELTYTDDAGSLWIGRGEYFADSNGVLDIARMASLAGTYTGIDARGLFWSAMPCLPEEQAAFFADRDRRAKMPGGSVWLDPTAPVITTVRAWVLEGTALTPVPIGEAQYSMLRMAPDMRVSPVREGRLRGMLYEPASVTPDTPITIVLSGSNGGIPAGLAALFASHGIVALALGTFGYEDLPASLCDIPLEYFHEAARWLSTRYQRARIGVTGGSRGGELSLLLGASFPDDFSAVVAMMPVHVVCGGFGADMVEARPAWTLAGEAPDFIGADSGPYDAAESDALYRGAEHTHRPLYFRMWSPEAEVRCAIRVENSRAAILMLSGTADEIWPATEGSARALRRLQAHHYPYPARHIAWEGAGHLISRPAGVDFSLSAGMVHPVVGYWIPLGGLPAANAHASLAAFAEACAWLRLYAVEAQE